MYRPVLLFWSRPFLPPPCHTGHLLFLACQSRYNQVCMIMKAKADATIFSANPAAERILGLSFDQMRCTTSLETHVGA